MFAGPAQHRLFRALGLAPGHDFTVEATAAMTGLPPARAAQLLESLSAHSLLQHHTPGRFRFHALLRLYAGERAAAEDRGAALASSGRWSTAPSG